MNKPFDNRTQILIVVCGDTLNKENKLKELRTHWVNDLPEGSKIIRTVEDCGDYIAGYEARK